MSGKTSFYVLTDTHFLSKRAWEEGKPVNNREKGDQIALKASPEILDSFFEKIAADTEISTVIITGDLVNSGEKISHDDFYKKLTELEAKGKKIYVTTATHDYAGEGDEGDENIFHATYYGKDGTLPTERVSKKELLPLYYHFGPDTADSVHESGSYSVKISDDVRLIAINDNGNGRSHCGLFEDGMKWLREQTENAEKNGETVIWAVHHPVIPPWPVYEAIARFEMVGGFGEMRSIMCEEGVKIVFTGHTHVHGIKKYTDELGRWFYDVSTTALCSAEGKIRKVVIDTDKGCCDISSIGIETIKGVDTNGKSARDYIYLLNFGGLMEKLLPLAHTDFGRFLTEAEGFLNTAKLAKKKCLVKNAAKIADCIKMSTLAKHTTKYHTLTKEQIKKLRSVPVKDVAFNIVAHVFPGNAPYTPDTDEYKVIHAVTEKADKAMKLLHIKLEKYTPGIKSLSSLAEPFLYNNRTGDDNSIHIDFNK